MDDRWQWHIHSSTKYIIISAYHFLTAYEHVTTTDSLHNIRHKAVLWKPVYLLVVCIKIVFLLPITYCSGEFFKIINNSVTVWVVMVLMRISIICFALSLLWNNSVFDFWLTMLHHNQLFSHFQPLDSIWTFTRNFKASSINNEIFIDCLRLDDQEWKKYMNFQAQGTHYHTIAQ